MTVSFLPPGLPLSIFSTRALDLRPLPALAPPLAVPSFAIKSPSFPVRGYSLFDFAFFAHESPRPFHGNFTVEK
jgi:hypothetical protein